MYAHEDYEKDVMIYNEETVIIYKKNVEQFMKTSRRIWSN